MAGKIPPALPAARSERLRFWPKLGLVCLCALSVIVSGLALDIATDRLDEAPLRATLRAAAADNGPKIAFLGTSRFLRGVNPNALGEALAEQGCAASVYVFAAPNLSAIEEERLAGRLGATGGFALLVLDRTVLPVNWRDSVLRGDPAHVWDAISAQMDLRGATPLEDIAIAYDSFRIGVLGLLSRNRIGPHFESLEVDWRDYVNGYLPFGEGELSPFESYSDAYRRRIAHSDDLPRAVEIAGDDGYSVPVQWADRLRQRARRVGWNGPLAYLFMPVGDVDEGAPAGLSSLDRDLWLVNLNDPRTHEQLASESNWFDAGHLSNLGTERFAPLLAQQVCALMEPPNTYALR